MTLANSYTSSFVRGLAAALLVACLIVPAAAQDETTRTVGIADDWSHHHLVFSDPGTAEQAMQNGTYEQWLSIQKDPRYLMQLVKRYAAPKALDADGAWIPTAGSGTEVGADSPDLINIGSQPPPKKFHRDWSMSMGSGATIAQGQYPAKFSFSTTQAFCDSDPTPDFVVYPTNLAGTGATAANGTITFSGVPSTSATAYIRIESIQYFYTSASTVTAPTSSGQCNVSTGGMENTAQTNLFNAITVPASGTAATYLCTGAVNSAVTNVVNTLGTTHTITMSGTDGNFTLSKSGTINFVAVTGGTGGTVGQASIVAYDNLYSGCSAASGLKPLIYWQYNTAGGIVPTSPVLSADGKQLAFVQTSGGVASLVLLKWAPSGAFVTLSNTAAASYRTCPAPCMTVLTLSGSPNDSFSSPFYDYKNDVLYVGDDVGVLHKFQNIFNAGTPAEVTGGTTTSGWPNDINTAGGEGSTDPLTSPVFDSTSGNVLVFMTNRSSSATHGGKLARIPAAGGSNNIVISGQVADAAGYGFQDGPLVDSTAGTVYGFLDDGFSGSAQVVQLTTTFITGALGNQVNVGAAQTTSSRHPFDGTFDNTYYSSGNPASPSGNLYVCGRAAGSATPTLYQVPITSNVMGSPVIGPALAGGTADCSPVAEFFNSPTDWIFLSQTGTNRTASPISCPTGTGCLMNFNVTSASGFGTGKATSAVALEASGTSAIVIDNSLSSPTGTSQVYFSPLSNQACAGNNGAGSQGQAATGGCATQASQSALQ